MAQNSYFFNAVLKDGVWDREYQAADFARYFGRVLSTGLLHTDEMPGMEVNVESGTLNTLVSVGDAIMKGYYYENTGIVRFNHAIPEPNVDRIDRIVLRLDTRLSERNVLLHLKQGVPAANPVPPPLQRDEFIYELSLTQVPVRANTSQLQQSDLIDERLNEDVCGLVSSLISIPTSQFLEQWNLFFSEKSSEINNISSQYLQQMHDDLIRFNNDWDEWFANQRTEGFVMQPEFTDLEDNFIQFKNQRATPSELGLIKADTNSDGTIMRATSERPGLVKSATESDGTLIIPEPLEYGRYSSELGFNNADLNNVVIIKDKIFLAEKQMDTWTPYKTPGSSSTLTGWSGFAFDVKKVVEQISFKIVNNNTDIQWRLREEGSDVNAPNIREGIVSNGEAKIPAPPLQVGKRYVLEILRIRNVTRYIHGFTSFPDMVGVKIIEISSNGRIFNNSGVFFEFSGVSFTYLDEKYTTGTITEKVKPKRLVGWYNIRHAKQTPVGTAVTLDLLDMNGAAIQTNIPEFFDLTLYDPTAYPELRLRWNLSRTTISTQTPQVINPSISWEGEKENILVDEITGIRFKLVVSNGALMLEEV